MSKDEDELQITEVENIQYAPVKEAEVYVDPTGQGVKEFKDLSTWEQIVEVSKKYSMAIHAPKKNCKKCFERGYVGFEINKDDGTRVPRPCRCIFEANELKKMDEEMKNSIPNNRAGRKFMEKYQLEQIKRMKKNLAKKIDNVPTQQTQKEVSNEATNTQGGSGLEGQRLSPSTAVATDSQGGN